MNSKKFFHSLLIFLCTFFLIFPLTNVAAKSKNHHRSNHHKQTEIHDNKHSKIHHNKQTKNQDNKHTKIHNNKQTQIHLHLNQCSKNEYSHVYVKLNGEWKELTNQGKSSLYKLLDSGQYVSDDITEFKLKSRTSEVTVPISRMRVGMEANGTINFWLSKCPKVEQPQKEAPPQIKTEISLDLKGSYEHYSKIYLKIKGEWKEFTLHKKSSKFYLILKGRVKIEDITEVKCITLDNKEIIINVSKLKIKAKSTKNIELTLKQSPKSKSTVKHTQIHLHLQKCAKDFSKVYVQLNGKWVELNHQGKSPLYKLLDQGLYVKDDITSFKLVTKTGAEVVVPVSQLKVGVEANGTINYWLLICPKIDKPVEGGTNPPVKDEDKKPKPPKNNDPKPQPQKNPGSKSGEPVTTSDGTDQPKGPIPTTIDNNGSESETPTTGSLPQTGESSSAWYYILGFILIALGAILVNLKSGRK